MEKEERNIVFLVQQVFFACEAWGMLTDVTQNYSLYCFLKLNPNYAHVTGVAICFHELGCSDEGLNILLSEGKVKEIPFPNKNNIVTYSAFLVWVSFF